MTELVKKMIEMAVAVRNKAYTPYSHFKVGAVAVDEQGRFFAGANVENASYLQCCAETGAISAMIAAGGRRIEAFAITGGPEQGSDTAKLCTPCGACRQRLREFMAADKKIYVASPEGRLLGEFTMAELLPHSFGPENLEIWQHE